MNLVETGGRAGSGSRTLAVWASTMAESSVSRRRQSAGRPSLPSRLAANFQRFVFFLTLWSNRRPARRIKRGCVRYGNAWIPLDKFRHVQVPRCPSLLFSIFFRFWFFCLWLFCICWELSIRIELVTVGRFLSFSFLFRGLMF